MAEFSRGTSVAQPNRLGGRDGNNYGKSPAAEETQLAVFDILARLSIDHSFELRLSRGVNGPGPVRAEANCRTTPALLGL